MRSEVLCILFFASVAMVYSETDKLNLRPIIGVLAEPRTDTGANYTFFPSDYARWLAASGSRVAVLRYDMPKEQLRSLFTSINGLLLTGGGLSLARDTDFYQTVEFLYDLAREANDKGDFFPIWGTCQGFQLLTLLAAHDPNVYLHNKFDSYNYSIPIVLTPEAHKSRLFAGLLPQTKETFITKNCTQNLHHDGILPHSYTTDPGLAKDVRLLSWNTDKVGTPFGSTLEYTNYPFYGTQWHPERNQFDWGVQEGLDKSPDAIRAMQDLSFFFVNEARKNFHAFPTPEQEEKNLIYNWNPIYTGDQGKFPSIETYIFPNEPHS